MAKEQCDCGENCNCEKRWWKHQKHWKGGGGGGHLYGMGVLGALVYFLQSAVGIQAILLGIVKAIFWPGLLVFKALELLKF